ncbi:MAG: cupin domain-containing protein [Alphaproteobacteria bacterium]|nr:cupin domain-containing protein [Alphaproteobacteria bacterium]
MTMETASTDAQQDRAIYNSPENFFNWSWPTVPRHQFLAERDKAYDPDGESGLIPLDISDVLETPYPATIPAILARYVKVRAGESVSHVFAASGEVYYVLDGNGVSTNGTDTVTWGTGDVFCFPGGNETNHAAEASAILFCVTNEPLLVFENLQSPAPGKSRTETTHWPHGSIEQHLQTVYDRPKTAETSGVSVQFSTPATAPSRNTIPMINTAINTLESGGDQRPHRHNGAAITLAIEGEGIHSMIEDEEVPWVTGAAQITPGAELHSHHNRGNRRMRSFVVQDEGLHFYLRTAGFSWD